MNYATGCAFNLDEMLINLDKSKLKMTSKDCEKLTGDLHKDVLIKRIILEACKLVFDDIVDNNATFYLPTGGRESCIHIKKIEGEEFKKCRLHGKFKDVDYLSSNFSGNLMIFQYRTKNYTVEKPIYLNKKYRDKITKNTNEGKQYC